MEFREDEVILRATIERILKRRLLLGGTGKSTAEALVKELLWKQTQKIVLGKESTTQMTTKEVNEIYEVINRFLAKHGVHIAFPSIIGESLESIK